MQTIGLNQRFLIGDNPKRPLAWQTSSINDLFPPGVTKLIFKQDLFNPAIDNTELMIANYYSSQLPPDLEGEKEPIKSKGRITCNGKTVLKIGGSPKTLSGVFEDEDGNTLAVPYLNWTLTGLPDDAYDVIESGTQVTISVRREFSLIGNILRVIAENPLDNSTAMIELEVVSL